MGFNLTNITALYSHTPLPLSFSRSLKVHNHSQKNRMQPWLLFFFSSLSTKQAFLFSFSVRNLWLPGKLNSYWWHFHCWHQRGTMAEEGQRLLMENVDVRQWRPETGEAWSVTSYNGAQIPLIHSSWSPGNSSFLFRSKMAWKHKG